MPGDLSIPLAQTPEGTSYTRALVALAGAPCPHQEPQPYLKVDQKTGARDVVVRQPMAGECSTCVGQEKRLIEMGDEISDLKKSVALATSLLNEQDELNTDFGNKITSQGGWLGHLQDRVEKLAQQITSGRSKKQ